jgi:hypothetical protein
MGLFSTLLNNASNAEASGTTPNGEKPSSSPPADLPTVIQLFSKFPIPISVVDTAAVASEILDTGGSGSGNKKNQPPKRKTLVNSRHSLFAPLHYFAVQCRSEDPNLLDSSNRSFGGLRKNARNNLMEAKLMTPDLGVWNCRADGSAVSDALLPMAVRKDKRVLPLFCLVVDLSQPLNTIETSVTTIQQALVRYLIQHYQSATETQDPSTGEVAATAPSLAAIATTSQYLLQTVQFGLADKDAKGTAQLQAASATVDDETKNVKIALQICVVQFTKHSSAGDKGDETDYKTRQQFTLLAYHLRKYAAALNASLVFVEVGSTASGGVLVEGSAAGVGKVAAEQELRQPAVTTWELPIVWRALASGVPVWKYNSIEAIEAGAALDASELEAASAPEDGSNDPAAATTLDSSSGGFSLIYGPDNHNPELIESVLLRNASFPGHWDAATDSLWKILPSAAMTAPTTASKPTVAVSGGGGDQGWLKELFDSIAPANDGGGMQTPPPKGKPTDTTKTPNDEAVSSFFEDLLK